MSLGSTAGREWWLRMAVRVQLMSILWIATETTLSAFAALTAGSLAISAFSVDSAIELVSAVVLLIRLLIEQRVGPSRPSHAAERAASFVVAGCLFTLGGFIAWRSGQAFAAGQAVPQSPLGLAVAALSSLITPGLARIKHRLGRKLSSAALIGDAACSMTCAYMAWTLLAGILLQAAFGWWFADPVAALGILYFVMREAWDSWDAAVHGSAHVHGH